MSRRRIAVVLSALAVGAIGAAPAAADPSSSENGCQAFLAEFCGK
jgi:hypothetical protein